MRSLKPFLKMGGRFLKIEVVYPGRIKNSFAKEGFEEYLKRLNRFFKLSIVSIPSCRSSDRKRCVEEESKKLLKYIGSREFILLDVEGKELNTSEFSQFIGKHLDSARDLTFVVGGVYGVSAEVKKRSDLSLSLSRMTFTHSITLMILAEQLYRAAKILSGQPYDH